MNEKPHANDSGPGWIPFAMLAYLAFFFVQPALDGAGALAWLATLAGGAVFVALYFTVFVTGGWRPFAAIALIAALGFVFAPYNAGALVFFIYVGLLLPFVTGPRLAAGALAALVGVVLVQAWVLDFSISYWLPASLCPAVAGLVNINVAQRRRTDARLRLAREEVENLAKIAERERIARDLHDVLGHTMSVIILKSELASKLVARDPERAASEMREVERISRDALAEIREAIRGYRSGGLPAEIARARETLETAGVAFECAADASGVPAAEENVLALVVREAVTNVVRHAGARSCRLDLRVEGGACRLEIADDGRGAGAPEGNGLRGMRERVEALGGTMRRETSGGTRLAIALPLARAREGSAV